MTRLASTPLRVVVAVLLLAAGAAAATAQVGVVRVYTKVELLERKGWAAVTAGNAAAAAAAFGEALKAEPRRATLHVGLAVVAALRGRDDEAESALRRALALDPNVPQGRRLLGLVLYRRGNLAEAIRTFEAVVAAEPDNTELRVTLERWQREFDLQTRMQTEVGSAFTVSFDGPAEAPLADKVLESLDRASWRIGAALGTYPLTPVPVVLYTKEQFTDVTRAPEWAAGGFDGTIRIPMRDALDKQAELDRVLAHELTHAFVRSIAARGVPLWLNEGLAVALERDQPLDLGPMPEVPVRVHLERLPQSFSGLSSEQADAAYAVSGLAGQRLLDLYGGPAVTSLLRDLGEGVDFASAFEHRMQQTFDDFESQLLASQPQ
jgi:tetratricopeptide (TPR) repeat protein